MCPHRYCEWLLRSPRHCHTSENRTKYNGGIDEDEMEEAQWNAMLCIQVK